MNHKSSSINATLHFKYKKTLALMLVFVFSIVSIPWSRVEAVSQKFDFESGMSGSTTLGDSPGANKSVSQTLLDHTLVITQDQGHILYMPAIEYNGNPRTALVGVAVIMDGSYDTATKLTLTI